MSLESNNFEHVDGNVGWTAAETVWNVSKGALVGGLVLSAGMAASQIGLHVNPDHLNNILETARTVNVPFWGGLAVGVFENVLLRESMLNYLKDPHKPKLKSGNYKFAGDGHGRSLIYHISCVDPRIPDNDGGKVAGSFAVLGSELASVGAAVLTKATFPEGPATDFLVGKHLGSNLWTELTAHLELQGEINAILADAKVRGPGRRVVIQMMNHLEACGAQGFTNMASYYAKKAHLPVVADVLGLPNEVLGFMYVNSVLSPCIAALSGGQVNLCAVVKHSDIVYRGEHQPVRDDSIDFEGD